MNDLWEQHVLLEISDAYDDLPRLLAIHEALMLIWQRHLIPDDVETRISLHLNNVLGM
jgi:hypothetical protein